MAARSRSTGASRRSTSVASKPARPAQPAARRPAARKPSAPKPAARPSAKSKGKAKAAGAAPKGTDAAQRALRNMKAFLDRTLGVLDEADAGFVPMPGMFSVAQQVAHVAQTCDWFLEGAFRPTGFDMDFAALEQQVRAVTSLAAARAWLDQAHERLQKALAERPLAAWQAPIAADTLMAGAPRLSIVDGLVDHTAHHRGALSVYVRLRGKTPLMPYM